MSSITSSGFKYYMDQLAVDNKSLLVAYDFTNNPAISNGLIYPTFWSSGCYTGVANGNLTNFFQSSGSGFLNSSNSIDISGSIPDNDFSFLFCYEKLRTGNEILLSSAAGSTFGQRSGITLGVNDINKLYLEYWNPVDGRFSMTYSKNIASKNIVYLNKSNGRFNLGVFDPGSSALSIEYMSLVEQSYSHSNKFRIGNKFDSNNWSMGNGFSGFLDDFYCLSQSLPQDYYSILSSGFYSSYQDGMVSGTGYICDSLSILTGSGIILGTGVTGYVSNVTYTTGYVPSGYYESGYSYYAGTGVTGYYNKFIGNYLDNCEFTVPLYVRTPLTGNIYLSGISGIYTGSGQVITPVFENKELTGILTGEVFVPVNVDQCSAYTGYYPPSIVVDSGFMFSLGFNAIYSKEPCSNISIYEAYLYTGLYSSDINLKPDYDSFLSEYSVSINRTGYRNNLIFNNGVLLLESRWSSYLDGYLTKYNISGDIFLDKEVIRSNAYNEVSDSLIYDYSTGISELAISLRTGSASGADLSTILPYPYSDYFLFLNGIKLISGADYTNNKINFDIPASSVLIKTNANYISKNKIYLTGSSNSLSTNGARFLKNMSNFYVNGVRQYLGDGYMEYSTIDLLSGCGSEFENNLLYTSTVSDNFWNT